MSISAKHTNEALSFMTLYKSMAPEIKKEVKEMIVEEIDDEEINMLTTLSFQSLDLDDDQLEEESAIWENFYKEQKGV